MDTDAGGSIQGVSLDSFLQMVQVERTTCTLTVKAENEVGHLYVLNGDLIAAETGDLKNVAAAHRIISWDKSTIEIENVCNKEEKQINEPLMNILMEGLKLRDENILKTRASERDVMAEDAEKIEKELTPPPPSEDPFAEVLPETPAADVQPFEELSMEDPAVEDIFVPEPRVVRQEIPIRPEVRAKKKPKVGPAEKLRKKRIMVLSAAVVAMAIIVIGAVYVMGIIKSYRIEKEYQGVLEQIENRQTLKEKEILLRNFIDSRGKSKFALLAQDKIKEIHKIAEERYYQDITAKVDNMPLNEDFSEQATAAYNQFLEAYPRSVYSPKVRQRISTIPELIDDFDYEKLKAVSQAGIEVQAAAYNQYLENHPNGKYSADVKQLISDMSEAFYDDLKKEITDCDARGKWEKCIELCSFFISSFPNHRRWDEVVVVKNEMQAKIDLAVLAEMAKEKGADYEAAKQIYLTYLKEHPKSPEKNKIMEEVERLDSQIKGKREPRKVRVSKQRKTAKQRVTEGSQEDATKISSLRTDKERLRREREKMRAQLKPLGRYVAHGDGTFADSVTGLMWSILDSHLELGECLDYEDATRYVKNLTVGGYRDWRLPTSSNLAGIYKTKPFFPDSGASWYWTSKTYVDGHHRRAGIVTTEKETVFKREYA
ncbi:DUF4388 domain-containing protein, partial [Thermodesulfobacteriota bacterium]